MKRLFSKLVLVFAITLMAGFASSCSSNDDDDNVVDNNYTRAYTFYITTDKLTLDPGAPFTKETFAKKYYDAMNLRCDGTWLDSKSSLDAALQVYNAQENNDQTKYLHGSVTIMCHVKSTNKDMPLYKYDIDSSTLEDLQD